jgi:hypothetical protein
VTTPTVITVKAWDVLPPGIRTLAGTVTEGSELLRETEIPLEGAYSLIVTMPMEFIPPVTAVGLKVAEERTIVRCRVK